MKIIDACKRRFSSLSKEEKEEALDNEWWDMLSYDPFIEYDKSIKEAAERKRMREAKNLRKKKVFPKMKRRIARTKKVV